MVAVIVAVPAATAVTVPFSTVATAELFVLQVTDGFVASEGATVAVNVSLPPTARDNEVLSRLTPVTATVVSPESVPPLSSELLPEPLSEPPELLPEPLSELPPELLPEPLSELPPVLLALPVLPLPDAVLVELEPL